MLKSVFFAFFLYYCMIYYLLLPLTNFKANIK